MRLLGVGFICLVLLFVWVTYAFFNKTFVSTVPITIEASTTGLQLPKYADVKLRGMIVGEVRDFTPVDGGVELHVAIDPDMIDRIPSNVTATILPKTLFGEKFVHLDVEGEPSSTPLAADDVIAGAEVPIEVERLLIDGNELLQAVNPQDIAFTLNAVAEALEGRGDALGESFETLNAYLQEINPEVPLLIDDLEKFGEVAEIYDAALPDLADMLDNLLITGDTLVEKRGELNSILVETRRMSDTVTRFVDVNAEVLVRLPREALPVLEGLSYYSETFPCVLQGIARVSPRLETVFRDSTVHIHLEMLPLERMPNAYEASEFATIPSQEWFETTEAVQPDCRTLPDPEAAGVSQENPVGIPPFDLYQALGIDHPHNKFDWFEEQNRAPVGVSNPNPALADLDYLLSGGGDR